MAVLSVTIGLAIGLLSGYHRHVDAIVMRVMDGVMAIPAILLAIALIALVNASVQNVIIALTIPEIPRVVRVVRAVVLSLREQMYIEASRATGANLLRILVPPYPAQYGGSTDCPGYLHLRVSNHCGSVSQFPRRWYATGNFELGQYHGGRTCLRTDCFLDLALSGGVPGHHGAGHQSAGRWLARHAGP